MSEYDPVNVDVVRMLQALGIDDFRDQGGEVWAPCPYPGHREKTPSWSISIDDNDPVRNGFNHCFGCHEQGGPVHLVAQVVGLSGYGAARDWLRERKLDMGTTTPLKAKLRITRPGAQGAFKMPAGVVQEPLARWNSVARRYVEARGIPLAQVERWRLALGKFGKTRQRIVFPAYDREGVLLRWTARAYAGQDRGLNPEPKYREPNLAEGADPSGVFGEEFWPVRPARDTVVICEGAINALACERAGARYVGALSGSELDKGQLLKIAAFGRVLIATDLDQAGSDIARELRNSLARWKRVRRMELPPGQDPADIALADLADLKRRLAWDDASQSAT